MLTAQSIECTIALAAVMEKSIVMTKLTANRKRISRSDSDGLTGECIAALALEGACDGLWDWDRKSGRIYYDNHWKALAGYGTDELSDDPDEWFSRIHNDDRLIVRKMIDDHMAGKTAHFRSEHRLLHNDGTYRWVLARGTAVRISSGRSFRIVGTLTDINDRKMHELELLKQLDELRFAIASEKVLMEELDRKNRELVELSITDGLTGLYNHRFLQERFDFEFKRIRRYGGALSCLLLDIDHFKALNDTYGHQFGDYVIKQIATIIKTRSREVDICGRYGGEEFMVISNLQKENALKYASKLHAAIENHRFEHPEAEVRVTVSIGVAEYNNDVKTKQELIERADRAMYRAKNDGRNLIRLWKETDEPDALSGDRGGIDEMKKRFRDLSSRMRSAYMESTDALIKAVEAKDPFAHEHSANVSAYSVAIAKSLVLPEETVEIIRFAAMLHDIGKISVPNSILRKKGNLTVREQQLLNRHPEVGVTILKDIRFLEKEIPVILYHHERYDGKGFPHGLKGREIPLGARIVAVADAFDKMVTGRFSGRKMSENKACEKMKKQKGSLYSPEVVDAFLAVFNGSGKGRGEKSKG